MPVFERLEPDPSKADHLPYAPAVRVPAGSEYFFLSGVSALPLYHAHPHDPAEVGLPDDAAAQTERMMRTLTDLLADLGLSWSNVIHMYEFLTDMRDTDAVHRTMYHHLVARPDAEESWTPSSTLIGVNRLSAPGARVEFDIIAARPPSGPVAARPRPARVEVPGHGPIASVASDEELLWMSGSTAIDFYHHHPHIEDEEDVPYRASGQVRKIFEMFDPVLDFMEVGWGDVVKLYEWATDSRDLAAFDAEIGTRLAGLGSPPRTTVDIDALSGPPARLELEMVATRGPRPDAAAGGGDHEPVIEELHPQPERAHLLPYAPAVRVADAPLHFLSGVGPAQGELGVPDDIVAQTRSAMDALDAHLAALGLSWRNVVKLIQQVVDIREAEQVGTALAERYGTSWAPAMTLTEVDALPYEGARVQFDVIAAG
ncbi:MAG: RidA family protein [Microbacteriaceae bacterium]|nr:RidA family protein [Microbacteriaceae bacterium]